MAVRIIKWTEGGWKVYADAAFTTGTTDLTIHSDLGRDSTMVIIDSSGGTMNLAVSEDGTNFGDNYLVQAGRITLEGLRAFEIRLTHVSGTVDYQIVVY